MEEEWHISDSEEEENMDNTSKIINTRLEKLSSLSRLSGSKTFVDQNVPRNLTALYEQIANDGFITLQCQRLSSKGEQVETQNIPTVSALDNETESIKTEDRTDNTTVTTQTQPSQSTDFDYKEELFETTIKFPKRSQKSGIDKYKKTKKRVGTMENVINDLSRFRELDAEAMANQNQQ